MQNLLMCDNGSHCKNGDPLGRIRPNDVYWHGFQTRDLALTRGGRCVVVPGGCSSGSQLVLAG